MIIWIDAQISPAISKWITENYPITARAVRDIGLREASEERIFTQANKESVIVMTKDSDFVRMLEKTLDKAIKLLNSGEDLVEISDI